MVLPESPIKMDILANIIHFLTKNYRKIGDSGKIMEEATMHSILKNFQTAYVSSSNLIPILNDYAKPYDLIARLVKEGELIRLKNGFFIIAEKIQDTSIPYDQIANLLYGPSYLSLEWALSYYAMIPEGVYVVTSVSAVKSKSYPTPLGTFDYTYLSHSRYSVGINNGKNEHGNFLIASPEKALADLVHFKCQHLTAKELLVDLIEARRIDEDHLKQLNKNHIYEISKRYRSRAVATLTQTIGLI